LKASVDRTLLSDHVVTAFKRRMQTRWLRCVVVLCCFPSSSCSWKDGAGAPSGSPPGVVRVAGAWAANDSAPLQAATHHKAGLALQDFLNDRAHAASQTVANMSTRPNFFSCFFWNGTCTKVPQCRHIVFMGDSGTLKAAKSFFRRQTALAALRAVWRARRIQRSTCCKRTPPRPPREPASRALFIAERVNGVSSHLEP